MLTTPPIVAMLVATNPYSTLLDGSMLAFAVLVLRLGLEKK